MLRDHGNGSVTNIKGDGAVCRRIIAVIPAGDDWFWVWPATNRRWIREPVPAWALMSDGAVDPLVLDADQARLVVACSFDEGGRLWSRRSAAFCVCGRRIGDDGDRSWCAECGAEIDVAA